VIVERLALRAQINYNKSSSWTRFCLGVQYSPCSQSFSESGSRSDSS